MEQDICTGPRESITKMGRIVARQLQDALRAFDELNEAEADRISERDDVVDNLNLHIEEQAQSLSRFELQPEQLRFVRSTVKVSLNLERIGDAACHIARRVHIALGQGHRPVPFDMEEMEAIALAAINESTRAYLEGDIRLAQSACLREPQLDALYVRKLGEIEERMRRDVDAIPYLLHWNSVLKYLEKVCDYTLNIGEQAIYLVTGRRLKFAQYRQLDRMMSAGRDNAYVFSPYYDGISGAAVARLSTGEQTVVFKQGSRKKLQAEAEKLRHWESLFPSLTPHVIAVDRQGDREALLREFVAGELLCDLYQSSRSLQDKLAATSVLLDVTLDVWRLTLKTQVCTTSYADEIRSRLSEVYAMHPYLEFVSQHEGLDRLVEEMGAREGALAPAFQVWLHGDFNMNNVVYLDHAIKFIDVHRSAYGDYLADAAVFLVSLVRQPRQPENTRAEMAEVAALVRRRIDCFGREHGDDHGEERLRSALARSYLTSARVIVDESHARSLFLKGIRLLQKEVATL